MNIFTLDKNMKFKIFEDQDGFVHDISGHIHRILKDKKRSEQFRKAVKKIVRKGDVVFDLGSGTGLLSFFTYSNSPGKIYSVESGDLHSLSKEIGKKRGYDKIVFIQDDFETVKFPEKADLIISECIGEFGITGNMINKVLEVREKYLKPGGKIIPQNIGMKVSPVSSTKIKDELFFSHYEEMDYELPREYVTNCIYMVNLDRENKICPEKTINEVNLESETKPVDTFEKEIEFTSPGPMKMVGFCGWHKTRVYEDFLIDSGPGNYNTWGQLFFPLPEEVELEKDDQIILKMKRYWKGFKGNYFFSWKTRIIRKNKMIKEFFSTNETECLLFFDKNKVKADRDRMEIGPKGNTTKIEGTPLCNFFRSFIGKKVSESEIIKKSEVFFRNSPKNRDVVIDILSEIITQKRLEFAIFFQDNKQ